MIIETTRLRLRELTKSDESSMAELLGDPEVMKFAFGPPLPSSEVRPFLVACIHSYAQWGYGLWAATSIRGGEFMGYAGLTHYDDMDGSEEVELGYRFLPAHWDSGLATEAAGAVVEYAEGRLGLKRLIALIRPSNRASIRVAEKVGMTLQKELLLWEKFTGLSESRKAIGVDLGR